MSRIASRFELIPLVIEKLVLVRRRLCLKILILTRALPLGNGRSLRTTILRSFLAQFSILQLLPVYFVRKNKILEIF